MQLDVILGKMEFCRWYTLSQLWRQFFTDGNNIFRNELKATLEHRKKEGKLRSMTRDGVTVYQRAPSWGGPAF